MLLTELTLTKLNLWKLKMKSSSPFSTTIILSPYSHTHTHTHTYTHTHLENGGSSIQLPPLRGWARTSLSLCDAGKDNNANKIRTKITLESSMRSSCSSLLAMKFPLALHKASFPSLFKSTDNLSGCSFF